jgi:hypothetical protein
MRFGLLRGEGFSYMLAEAPGLALMPAPRKKNFPPR